MTRVRVVSNASGNNWWIRFWKFLKDHTGLMFTMDRHTSSSTGYLALTDASTTSRCHRFGSVLMESNSDLRFTDTHWVSRSKRSETKATGVERGWYIQFEGFPVDAEA